ncbi:MAG: branched-chain amino acid ABC transporter permease [Archaeoglobaceae archaeon]
MAVLEGAIIYSNLIVLISIGLTMTYITTGVPNLAQGTFAVVGSYMTLAFFRVLDIHPYMSLPLVFVLGGILGLAVYLAIIKPLISRGAGIITLMISTLGIDLVLYGGAGAFSDILENITRKSAKNFIFTPHDFPIWGFQGVFVISVIVIVLMLSALYVLLFKTKFGVAMRASMENPSLAQVMGVNVETTRLVSWALSGGFACVAGALLPFKQQIYPFVGDVIIVSVIAASIVGGLGTIFGAVIGGYIIGISESFVTFQLSKIVGPEVLVYSRVVSLIVLILMLFLAPKGILSIKWRRLFKWSSSSS